MDTMAASNNDGDISITTAPLSMNRTKTNERQNPLPLSIAVRNLFPLLVLSDATHNTVDGGQLAILLW